MSSSHSTYFPQLPPDSVYVSVKTKGTTEQGTARDPHGQMCRVHAGEQWEMMLERFLLVELAFSTSTKFQTTTFSFCYSVPLPDSISCHCQTE